MINVKQFITEHGLTMFYAIISALILTTGFSFYKMVSFEKFYPDYTYGTELKDNKELASVSKPTLKIQDLVVLDISETYDYKTYIMEATAPNGTNIKNSVIVYYLGIYDNAGINMSVPGTRVVRYKLTYNEVSTIMDQTVIIKNKGIIEE